MPEPMDDILNSSGVKQLEVLVEEATRSSSEGVRRFVEPAEGTLRRAVSRRHHIVFGRRGSGKSSLLRKASADLTVDRRPISFIDLETFKGHSYPDVLLSVLIEAFRRFADWLDTAAIHPASKTRFWERWFGKPKRPPLSKKEAAELSAALHKQVDELEKLLHAPDDLETETVRRHAQDLESKEEAKAELKAEAKGATASFGAQASASASNAQKVSHALETKHKYRDSKTEFLQRHILDYQRIFRRMQEISGGDSFLFLDDLYHIRRSDQAKVLDYFHRIAKGNGLWLKVGTIRHRTQWYRHGDPPTGLKIGDDADEIDLDLTLEKFSLTKNFLTEILKGFVSECGGLSMTDMQSPGALDRLVLASGGVARDFLGIFRRSIHVARERAGGHRGPKIGTEDVNTAAGEYESAKKEELHRDTLDEEERLEAEFRAIREFCTGKAKSNIFLLNKDEDTELFDLVQELVDLRLLHKVRSRVTVSGRKGDIFEAYMLDVSQYTASRKMRDLEIIEFWLPESQERLRRASLIYHHIENRPVESDEA